MKGRYTVLLYITFLGLLATRINSASREYGQFINTSMVSSVRGKFHELAHDDLDDHEPTLEAPAHSNTSFLPCIAPLSNASMSSYTPLSSMASGGLVFFLHIPKTGGTTIRLNLEKFDDRVQYIFAKNYSIYRDTAPLVEDVVLHGTKDGRVLVYEIHATTAPSFFRLRNRLRRWKETAARNSVPVFFFTVLRESVSFAFSHFSFFHLQKRNPSFERCNATEENFLRLSLHNPQCQFLFKGEPSLRAQKPTKKVVTPEECELVQHHMLKIFDWIGSTETLSNETISLLSRLLGLPRSYAWENHRISKDAKDVEHFGKENISASALQSIYEVSSMDMKFYTTARSRYRYDTFVE